MQAHGIRFGTDGWRGVMSDDFTVCGVEFVAEAVARYLKAHGAHKVLVAHDTRFLAELFADRCCRILSANGLEVLAPSRPMPTPVVAFAVTDCQADGAIMLTASHNPAVYNGIKFIPRYGGPANKQITGEIESMLASVSRDDIRRDEDLRVSACDPLPAYVRQLAKLVDFDSLRGLRVGLDVMYGAGQGIMRDLLVSAGVEVEALHEWRDVLFGGHTPEPDEANLKELRGTVLEKGLGLGLALDGDADRFGVVDPSGSMLTSNQVLAMVALHLLEDKGARGKLVRTVATTHLIDDIAREFDVECVETPVGFKYIAEEMLAGDVLIGGEESGGLSIAGHVPEKDGLLADLLVAELVAVRRKSPAEVLEEVFGRFGPRVTRRIDVRCAEQVKERILSQMAQSAPAAIGGLRLEEVSTLDGVKYEFATGAWLLVRTSGTEPLVRAYIEARDNASFQILEQWVRHLLDEAE